MPILDSSPAHAGGRAAARPSGVACERFVPDAGGRRCAYYLPTGACARPDEFMCVEWQRLNAGLPVVGHAAGGSQGVAAPGAAADRRTPVRESASPRAVASLLPVRAVDGTAPGVELECASSLGPVWIVPARGAQGDRVELTFDDAAVIARVLEALGGRVVAIHPRPCGALGVPAPEPPAPAAPPAALAVRNRVAQMRLFAPRGGV
jgi:hypothetical protein